MLNYLILSLAVLRLYFLLAYDNGPGNVLAKFRLAIGVRYEKGQSIATNGLSYWVLCEYCAPMLYSLVIMLLYTFYPIYTLIIASVLALSMVTIVAVGVMKKLGI